MGKAIKVVASDVDGIHEPGLANEFGLTHLTGMGFHGDDVYVFPVFQLGKVVPEVRLQRSARAFVRMTVDNDDKQFLVTRSVLKHVPKYAFEGARSNVTFEKSAEQIAEEKARAEEAKSAKSTPTTSTKK